MDGLCHLVVSPCELVKTGPWQCLAVIHSGRHLSPYRQEPGFSAGYTILAVVTKLGVVLSTSSQGPDGPLARVPGKTKASDGWEVGNWAGGRTFPHWKFAHGKAIVLARSGSVNI